MKMNLSSISASLCGKAVALAFIVGIFLSGCVSRGAYDADIARLAVKLQQERADHADTVRALEIKLKERARSLSELTDRYMLLQHEREQYQLPGLKKDMEILLKDLDELKLVVTSNLKGSEGREMVMKINDMHKRISTILDRDSKALAPSPIH
ncbi:MAG: hypothetical protein HY889_08000 [Deltaproteobacteria bacterium]|nr:hypothetical protein [Deltaproteobacteria bacterium]